MATTIQQIELPKKARALDTSGNNNHGQIYSGRGLEFDGVSDHLTASHTIPSDIYTVSLWAKFDSAGVFYLFDNRDGSNTDGIAIHSLVSGSSISLLVYHSASSVITTDYDLHIDTWYRVVLVKDGADFTLYCNGVEWATDSGNDNSSNGATITLGARYSVGNFLPGKMSNFQVWDTAWSAADVTYDYLNPESLALNNSGTALTESNLKLWYPMQDGHRGQQSYILDGANTGAGEELVTNGGFDTDLSGWTLIGVNGDNNVTWVDGKARFLYDDAISTSALGISQSSVTAGVNYKITFDIVVADGTLGKLKFYNNTTETSTNLGTGSHTIYFTALGSYIKFYRNSSSVDTDLTIDNISIKPINDKHHATTVFYGDEMWDGANGDVTNWTPFGNNTVEEDDGTLKFTYVDNVSGPYIYLRDAHHLSADLVVGATYELSITTKVNTGSATWRLQHNSYPTYTFSTLTSTDFVTQSVTFIATTVNSHYLFAGSFSAGEIVWVKDISLKEVGVASGWTDADQQLHIPQTALQSYNELAWFDGAADYVQLSDPYNHNLITVSAWIYLNEDTTLYRAIFANRDSGDDGLVIAIKPDETLWAKFNGTAVDSSATIPKGKWTHVVYTYDDATMKVYINGVFEDSTAFTGSDIAVTTNARIGIDTSSTQYYFPGSMTEVSIWGAALTQAEINELYNDGKALDATVHSKAITASTNLKGYFRNNGLSTWTDLSNDYSNNGTPTSLTETILIPQGVDSTRDTQGFIMNKQKDTSCLNFTSKGDKYVRVQDNPTVQLAGTAASWVFWVKLDSLSDGDQKLMSKAPSVGSTISAYQIRTNNDDLLFQIYSGSWRTDTRSDFFTSTGWTHVVVTIDSSNNVNFYKNGDVFGSEADIGYAVPANTGGLHVGARVQSTGVYDEFLKGQIDGVLLYNKELDSTEVLRNYNATKGNHRN